MVYIYLHLVDFYGKCVLIMANIPYMDPIWVISSEVINS